MVCLYNCYRYSVATKRSNRQEVSLDLLVIKKRNPQRRQEASRFIESFSSCLPHREAPTHAHSIILPAHALAVLSQPSHNGSCKICSPLRSVFATDKLAHLDTRAPDSLIQYESVDTLHSQNCLSIVIVAVVTKYWQLMNGKSYWHFKNKFSVPQIHHWPGRTKSFKY